MTAGAVASTSSARQKKEQQLLQGDTEVRQLVLDAVAKGVPGVHIENSVIDGDVLRTIEGASQVTITIHDQARNLYRSGVLQDPSGDLQAVDFNLDGLWFRLVKVTKQGDDIVLTAEERDVDYLRDKRGPRVLGSRKSVNHPKGLTRAEAVLQLIRSVKIHQIPVRIHELHTVQPIAKLTDTEREKRRKKSKPDSKEARDLARAPGFPDGAKIPHVNQAQLERISICLKQAEKDNAPERAVLAMLCAGFGESGWGEDRGSRGTTFQTTQIPESRLDLQAHYFLVGGQSFKRGGAIEAVKDKTLTVGDVASMVEISDAAGPHYEAYFGQARKILDEWGGVKSGQPGGSQKIQTYRKRYAFTVHPDETYWDAIQRYASDVNWRAFFSSGVFYFISEEDLFDSRARYRLYEGAPGVINIDHDWDKRKKINRATATVHIHRWAIPPGTIVQVDDIGPASGRWLVESVERSLFSTEATLNLKKPAREKKEPRTDLVRNQQAAGAGGGVGGTIPVDGDIGTKLLAAARSIGKHRYPYVWGGGHRKAGVPDRGTGRDPGIGFDCSGGVAACLKLAGILPSNWKNGVPASGVMAQTFGYPGQGETHTLWANGVHVFLEVMVGGKQYHLGTGRWGKNSSGFGVNPMLHPHTGFTPRHLAEAKGDPAQRRT